MSAMAAIGGSISAANLKNDGGDIVGSTERTRVRRALLARADGGACA